MAIKYREEVIEELEEEGRRLLDLLKTNPPNYREIQNKYNALRARIRYKTNPELRDRKMMREMTKYYSKKYNIQSPPTF